MMNETLLAKLVGAIMGSSIAVVFTAKESSVTLMVQKFIIGCIGGFISAPVIIDKFGWEHTFDYWLASSTLGATLIYFVLKLIFSGQLTDRFFKK